jgi:hypothetical protein
MDNGGWGGSQHFVVPDPLKDCFPHRLVEGEVEGVEGGEVWPVMVLYPIAEDPLSPFRPHPQVDCIREAGSSGMIVEHLAELFPEIEEEETGGGGGLEWDKKREYRLSNITVYVEIIADHDQIVVSSLDKWLLSCRENRVLNLSLPPYEEDQESFDSLLAGATIRNDTILAKNKNKKVSVMYREVHLGCTLGRLIRFNGVVLFGGVLALSVLPTNSEAHVSFKKSNFHVIHRDIIAP